ncbi:MAG: hypothetical protein A3G87_03125 [Omnitrophica bacterium RIFCSPLOWO2_12_FULL_50_11]|nr:MAG: hypothetical protein A3G87_03125 [Omnitrophica bacterium RIFCSPLOWO2_12_FULL_50_11]
MNDHLIKKMFHTTKLPAISFSLQDIPLKAQEMVGKMSISGVQPKLSLKLNGRRSQLTAAASGGEYILKPQVPQFRFIPENENCCMDIASELGIDTPPHCLLPLKDRSLAYVVKRFDRRGEEKIHQENFYQVLEKRDKYAGSLEEIGKKLKEISAVPGLDVQLFFERIVFNFLIGNGDGHSQNYSISYDEHGNIRLSPAYDIVCTKLVLPKGEDSALTLNGKSNQLKRNDFDALADCFNIPAKVRYEKFERKSNRMRQFVGDSKLQKDFQKKFIEIILSRYERLRIVF